MNREEIITKVKNMTGMDTDEVTHICHDWIDYVQDDIVSRHDWSWLTGYNYIVTTDLYDTGTIAVTNGSATVTGTDTTWTSAMVGRAMALPDGNMVEIEAVDSTTEITLKAVYVGDDATAQEYYILQVYYDLASDFKKMKFMTRIEPSAKKLPPLSEMGFSDIIPNPYQSQGEITAYMFAGNSKIKFWPMQTSQKMVQYSYIKKLSTINTEGAESIMPESMHQLFVIALSRYAYDMADVMNKAESMGVQYDLAIGKYVKEDMDLSLDRVEVMADEASVRQVRTPLVGFTPDHFQRY